MKEFQTWLDAHRGMATTLHNTLGINATMISNAKHGRILIPTSWMPTIQTLSKGRLTIEKMVKARNTASKRKMKAQQ